MSETRLLDELACARLMQRAGAFADSHDVEGFVALFTEDGAVDRMGQPFVGLQAIREFMEGRPRHRVTRHLLTPPVIELNGPDQARGVGSFLLYDGIDESGTNAVLPLLPPVLVGEFRQTYRRVGGDWRIATHAASGVFRPVKE